MRLKRLLRSLLGDEENKVLKALEDELVEFESRGSLDGWVNLNEDDEEEAMRHLSLKALEGQWDVDELDEEPYVHVWPCKRECCG